MTSHTHLRNVWEGRGRGQSGKKIFLRSFSNLISMLNMLKGLVRRNFSIIQFVRIPLQLILKVCNLLEKSGIDLDRSLPANVFKGSEGIPAVGNHQVRDDAESNCNK